MVAAFTLVPSAMLTYAVVHPGISGEALVLIDNKNRCLCSCDEWRRKYGLLYPV